MLRRLRRPGLERLEDRTALDASHAAGHLLVQFRDGVMPTAQVGTQLGTELPLAGLYPVDLAPGVSLEQALAAYRADPRVVSAEPDANLTTSWLPNDAQFAQQWGLRNRTRAGADINAPAAWGYAIGSRRVTVAVLDTGIDYTHPDLYQNIWVNQREIPTSRRANLLDTDRDGLITLRDLNDSRNKGAGKISDLNGNGYIDADDLLRPMTKDAQGRDTGTGGWADGVSQEGDSYVDDLVGWNFVNNTNRPFDDNGHGSHVAGTIGAMGNNGVGVAGINWQVELMAVKFFDSRGSGSLSAVIAGLNYAVAKGAKVSNHSWTGAGQSPSLQLAITQARAAGHIVVAAAGNSARNTDVSPEYPASFPLDNIVSVAATDANDNLASFSNYGTASVDIAGPGVNILSTNPGKSYGNRSGTSMSAPHVTGVLALVWSLRPNWTYRQVIDHVRATADRLPSLSGKVASGRVDAGNAIRAVFGLGPAQLSAAAVPTAPGFASTNNPGPRPSEAEGTALVSLPGWALSESRRAESGTSKPDVLLPPSAFRLPISEPVPAPTAGPRFSNLSSGRSSTAVLDELFSDPLWMEKVGQDQEPQEVPMEPARQDREREEE